MKNSIEIAQRLVVKDLDIETPGIIFSDIDKLKNWLTGEIRVLIDHDFQKLLNVLYRIDINEEKLKIAFSHTDPASELATLMIDRELQKVETREKYR